MPLDNANYVSELNLNNPVGSIDTVSMTDDFFRELKKVLKQSFPNINKQTTITSDELNNLKNFFQRVGTTTWDAKNSTLINVTAVDNSTAVQPRSYNDGRYLLKSNNLSDLTDVNAATNNLFSALNGSSAGYATLRNLVCNMTYPVGSVYMNYSRDNNPRDFFGVGTWVAYAQGRALIGAGYAVDDRGEGRTYGRGAAGGSFQHVLNINEIPNHTHQMIADDQLPAPWGTNNTQAYRYDADSDGKGWAKNINVSPTGGNGAHNNMQPFVTVAVWVRTG